MIYIEVVNYETGEVARRFGPYEHQREADRVDDGVNINLDHEHWFTRQVDDE